MGYKRVSDLLDDYWDKPWSELPSEQRQAWREVTPFTDTDSVFGPCKPVELIFWDDLDPKGRQQAASCHDAQHDPADEQARSTAFRGGFKETAYNGHAIKWRYWTSFRTLTARQFSCLVSALDPDVVDAGQTRLAAEKALQNAKAIERLAYNQGKAEASAHEWLKWADEQGFNVYWRFRAEFGQESEGLAIEAKAQSSTSGGEKTVQGSKDEVPRDHIVYLAALHKKFPAATARELRRECMKATEDENSPFHIFQNSLALKGTTRPISQKTFANWFTKAKKLP